MDIRLETRVRFDLMFSLHLRRLVATPARSFTRGRGGVPPVCLTSAHPSTSRRYPPCPSFLLTHRRTFVAGSTPGAPPPDSQPTSSISPTPPSSLPPSQIRPTLLSRLLPSSLLPNTGGTSSTSASFRKIVALARPERRPLLTAIGLLLVSSTVSLSIPFTVGRLIDYFTSPNPVCSSPMLYNSFFPAHPSHYGVMRLLGGFYSSRTFEIKDLFFLQISFDPQTIPYGITLTQATVGLLLVFTIGGACNAGRAFLIRMSGESRFSFA